MGDPSRRAGRREAMSRIQRRPEMEEAYGRAQLQTSWQHRHISRSDPVACAQAAAALRHFLAD